MTGWPWKDDFKGLKRADLPLIIEVVKKRSKKLKKFIDDLVAIFSVTQTSADASRYYVR
jgi:PII-like signaling protein